MITKVRFLVLPLVASAALWCTTGMSTPDEVIAQDESGLNMADGTTDNYGWWSGYGNYLGGFCCNNYPFYPNYYAAYGCGSCTGIGYGYGSWLGGWGGYGYGGGGGFGGHRGGHGGRR